MRIRFIFSFNKFVFCAVNSTKLVVEVVEVQLVSLVAVEYILVEGVLGCGKIGLKVGKFVIRIGGVLNEEVYLSFLSILNHKLQALESCMWSCVFIK